MSTLAQIRLKVRKLTGRPSPQQISDAQIDDYVNTFYQFDFPESLRLVTQETVFEFMTTENVDTYDMNTVSVWNGQENMPAVDAFINVSPPCYIAGTRAAWYQDRTGFFNAYPPLAQINNVVLGNNGTGPYATTLSNSPIVPGSVTVGAVDSTQTAANCIDVPINREVGTWKLINTNTPIAGSINYLTGALTITFNNTIPSGNKVTFTAVPYVTGIPQSVLFYTNVFTLRPVPSGSFLVKVNAFKSPIHLLSDGDSPQLRQWWQYLAYGASKKIFEDSQDNDGVNSIMPEFNQQQRFVLRRTIVQKTNQRVATLYSEQNGQGGSNFPNQF